MHTKEDEVPAGWFYQIIEQEKQCRDTDIPRNNSFNYMKNSSLYFLCHFEVSLLCQLLAPLVIKNDSTAAYCSGNTT